MGRFGVTEILVILAVVYYFEVKNSELMKGLGSGIKEFKTPLKKISQLIKDDTKE
jgi:Sec-independent protein translocase protein TatA